MKKEKNISRRVTLREVAASCGVAASTASGVLNNRSDCYASQDVRRRVIEAAERLRYRPNVAARALSGGATATVGMIVRKLEAQSSNAKCLAFQKAAQEHEYLPIMCLGTNEPEAEDRLLVWLREHFVDGIVLWPSGAGPHAEVRRLAEEGFPLVTFDGRWEFEFPTANVSVDYAHGGRLQAEHVLSLGCRRIGLIQPKIDSPALGQRVEAVRRTIAASGATLCEIPIEAQLSDADRGEALDSVCRRVASALRKTDRPEALIATNDRVASAAVRAVLRKGLRVPHDVAVVGFDDTGLSYNGSIPLTAVDPRAAETGRLMFEMLLEQMNNRRTNEGVEKRQILIKPRLIVRQSSVPSSSL